MNGVGFNRGAFMTGVIMNGRGGVPVGVVVVSICAGWLVLVGTVAIRFGVVSGDRIAIDGRRIGCVRILVGIAIGGVLKVCLGL